MILLRRQHFLSLVRNKKGESYRGTFSYYVITKCPKFEPPPLLFALVQFWQPPPPSNFQNLTSASPPSQRPLIKTVNFVILWFYSLLESAPANTRRNNSLNVPQVYANTNGIDY